MPAFFRRRRQLRERHAGEEPFFASFNFVHFHHTRDLLAPDTGPRLTQARSR
ncbi:MAG: hypothetical protein HC897_16350, partial [Thermoanaerobaculia bacterium]|nr:hypothetical protein [Thermoanaerobaculia bacterium]